VADHKTHIDETFKQVKDERDLLNDVEKAGSDLEKYTNNLDQLLLSRINQAIKLRDQLH
jgi:hypothetical protein